MVKSINKYKKVEEKIMKRKTAVITVVATIAAVGATVFMIKKGPELKEELLEKVESLKVKIKDLEVSDVADAIQVKLVEIKDDIKDFDWEKPKKEVEKKFYELKRQIKSVKKHMPLVEEEKASLIEEEKTPLVEEKAPLVEEKVPLVEEEKATLTEEDKVSEEA